MDSSHIYVNHLVSSCFVFSSLQPCNFLGDGYLPHSAQLADPTGQLFVDQVSLVGRTIWLITFDTLSPDLLCASPYTPVLAETPLLADSPLQADTHLCQPIALCMLFLANFHDLLQAPWLTRKLFFMSSVQPTSVRQFFRNSGSSEEWRSGL